MPWAHEATLRSGSDSTVQRLAAAGGKALGGGVSACADMGAVRYLMGPDGPRISVNQFFPEDVVFLSSVCPYSTLLPRAWAAD